MLHRDSNGPAVRALHCKPHGYEFEFGPYPYLRDIFPLAVILQPNIPGVTSVEAKQLNIPNNNRICLIKK